MVENLMSLWLEKMVLGRADSGFYTAEVLSYLGITLSQRPHFDCTNVFNVKSESGTE
uniref:hypothetical protein n=1 Tax=Microscilla sp. PRE1 TaxID=155537 RepID=UPI00146D6433|nr:hypothetical protein [Microscilla sp. PRE1]